MADDAIALPPDAACAAALHLRGRRCGVRCAGAVGRADQCGVLPGRWQRARPAGAGADQPGRAGHRRRCAGAVPAECAATARAATCPAHCARHSRATQPIVGAWRGRGAGARCGSGHPTHAGVICGGAARRDVGGRRHAAVAGRGGCASAQRSTPPTTASKRRRRSCSADAVPACASIQPACVATGPSRAIGCWHCGSDWRYRKHHSVPRCWSSDRAAAGSAKANAPTLQNGAALPPQLPDDVADRSGAGRVQPRL